MSEAQDTTKAADGQSLLTDGLERDAERYKKLRRIAVCEGNLEHTTLMEMLDFIKTDGEFDERIDAL